MTTWIETAGAMMHGPILISDRIALRFISLADTLLVVVGSVVEQLAATATDVARSVTIA